MANGNVKILISTSAYAYSHFYTVAPQVLPKYQMQIDMYISCRCGYTIENSKQTLRIEFKTLNNIRFGNKIFT